MYCNKCGTENEEDAIFCKQCGFNLSNFEETKELEPVNDKEKNKNDKVKTKTKTKKVKQKNKKQKNKKSKNVNKTYNEVKKEGMTLGQKFLMFILFILVLGIAVALGYVGYKYYTNKDMVEVPNVVGLTYEQAELRLSEEGLDTIEAIEETDVQENDGVVLDQDKASGKKVKKGSNIKVYVGEYSVELSKYEGVDVETVKSKLDDLGLKYSITEKISDKYDEGVVLSQSVKEGAKVKLDEVIKLVVAKADKIKESLTSEEDSTKIEEGNE